MHFDLRSQSLLIAASVFVGCAIVSFALYNSNSQALAENQVTIQRLDVNTQHLYGSSRAETVIVEFSDYQCPYCSRLHPVLKQIVDESDGNIAWEYRHLPLRSHPLAQPAAVLSECLAKNIGQDAFWQFTNNLFANQRPITATYIEDRAIELGLTDDQIKSCQSDTNISTTIAKDTEAAATLGGSGTPFSVIIFPDNSYKSVSGAVPKEQFERLISSYEE